MLYKYFVIASEVAFFVLLVILSDVASACGAGKSEQRGLLRVISEKNP